MDLRWKTFAIISVAVIGLVGILLVVTRTMMTENTAKMEQKTARQSVNLVLNALSNELDRLNVTTQDYAAWDDTYSFIQDGNPNYVDLNLMDATFANLRLSVMVFVNNSGQVLFGKAYDLNNGTEIPVPQSLLSQVAANPLILRSDSMKTPVVGTILLPEGPLLIASGPILHSSQQGPVQGTLITGRFLDATELAFLLKVTQLPLVVQVIADSPISSDFQTANQSLSRESPILVQPLNDERFAGYALLEDVYENPILILRADMPRDNYAQSQAGMAYATLFLSVIGVAFALLTMFLLEKFVVSRLTRLSSDVSIIGSSGDLSIRVSEIGKDELSSLGEGINKMLSSLRQTQKRLEEEQEALKQSEEKYRKLIEDSVQGMVILQGIPPRFVFANHMMTMMSGYTVDELLSLSPEKFESTVHPEDRAKFFKLYRDCLEGKPMSQPFEFRGVGKNGAVSWAEISFRRAEFNGQPAMQALFVDVNERRKAEDALRESEEKLRNTIESSPDAITITDLRGNIVDCNQAAVSLGGFSSKEELMGKSALELMAKRDHQRAMENWKVTAEKGILRNVPYTLMRKDGQEYPAELSAGVVRDAQGNLAGFVAILRDITERKEMQRELEEYSQQLEKMVEQRTKQLRDTQEQLVKAERLAAIGQVAAMVGHDLRNPLTGISGAAYYLKMKLGPKTEKKMIQMLEIIEKDIQYSNKIITDLMDYSREIKLELTETTPKSIIAESISLIQIPEKVQLADSTLNEPKIKIDIDKMKRVFANFLSKMLLRPCRKEESSQFQAEHQAIMSSSCSLTPAWA